MKRQYKTSPVSILAAQELQSIVGLCGCAVNYMFLLRSCYTQSHLAIQTLTKIHVRDQTQV